MSIRARLIVLAFLAVSPLMLERVHGLEQARAKRTEQAATEMIDLVRRGAEEQREVIYSVRALLQVVARVYAATPLAANSCNKDLLDLTGYVPWIHTLSVAGTDGRIKCSTEPQIIGLNVADRSHFQNALRSRKFALSDYLVSQTQQLPTLIAAFPAVRNDGSVAGVILASINLQWLAELATTAAAHSNTSILLVDGNGTLIAASADEEAFVGKHFSDNRLVHAMLTNDEGAVTTTGLDGVRRIFAYVRVPWTHAVLATGLDDNEVHSSIDREITMAYVQLVLVGVFVLLIAWLAGEQLIVRPIRSLVRTAARFGRGDLQARAAQESWIAEFRPLAAAFDDMARKLAAREEELRIANQHLDELASLDGLTGLANRRGFDRELERAWQHATERGEQIALMMIDIDHFKLFNDRYGHLAGDGCLRAVAETLSLVTLAETALVARYGGEEFAFLLPGADVERIVKLADAARQAIENRSITHTGAPCGRVTISIGIASLVPEPGRPSAILVEAADCALYSAKRGGRNMVVGRAPVLLSMAS